MFCYFVLTAVITLLLVPVVIELALYSTGLILTILDAISLSRMG